MLSINDVNLKGKRVIIRIDANVPVHDGVISSDKRLRACKDTIQYALDQGAAVILLSHLGRPKEGQFEEKYSLRVVAKTLSQLLQREMRFLQDWLNGFVIQPGEVILCENVRFNVGEKANAPELAKKMATLGDVFVNDAFATAHRAEASTVGIAEYMPIACAGLLLQREIKQLGQILNEPKKPILSIIGGAKVSTKLQVIKKILTFSDDFIPGGGIANTFLKAQGVEIGNSLYEADFVDEAAELLALAKHGHKRILLPLDVVVAKHADQDASGEVKLLSEVQGTDIILDVGPKSIAKITSVIEKAATILWNGPLGVFEWPAFAKGTQVLTQRIAESGAFSVAGGGDTVAAIDAFANEKAFSYVSTGGGAFLEFMEGKPLPAVSVLQNKK